MTGLVARTMGLATLGAALVLGTLSGCGGGCGGGKAGSILERLPAGAEGVGVLSMKALLDSEQAAKMEGQLFEVSKGKAPAEAKGMLAKIEHVAVVAFGAGKGGGGDCEKAADHVLKMLAEDMKGMDPPEAMRGELLKQCERDPSVADCLLETKSMKDLMRCEPGMGGGRPKERVAVLVLGEGLVADAEKLATATGMKAGDGVPKWKNGKRGGVHPLGEAGVVLSDDSELIETVLAAWEGKADRLDKNTQLWGWLAKVDMGADLVGAAAPSKAPPMVKGGAMSLGLGSGLKVKTYLVGDAELASVARQGLAGAKLAMAMVGDEQLGQFTAEVPIPKEEAKKILDGVKELVESAELTDSDGGILVEASADLDIQKLVALSADASKAAFQKYMARAEKAADPCATLMDEICDGDAECLATAKAEKNQPPKEACEAMLEDSKQIDALKAAMKAKRELDAK